MSPWAWRGLHIHSSLHYYYLGSLPSQALAPVRQDHAGESEKQGPLYSEQGGPSQREEGGLTASPDGGAQCGGVPARR